jgi:hypothetical protein
MYAQVEKSKENRKYTTASVASEKQCIGKSTFQFADNRPEAIAQRKLQEMANNSPQVRQLKALQRRHKIASGNQKKNPIQRKIAFIEADGSKLWYDDENIDLGIFPTKEKLVEQMQEHSGPVPIFDLSGKTSERLNELYGTKIYGYKNGPYTFNYTQLDRNGRCRIEVTTPNEDAPVGYAEFTMQTFDKLPAPAANENYTKAHVLGNAPKVAHLTHLYNNTLLRQGPDDMYRGFGGKLLTMVEQDAKGMGATIIYLEAASSNVRKEPNTNEMEMKNSLSFYHKFGYGLDGTAAAHNWVKAVADAQNMRLEESAQLTFARNQVKALMEGMICKTV